MKIAPFCVLKFIFISVATSQTAFPKHVCEYSGRSDDSSDIPLYVSEVPERCDLVTYGMYFFDIPMFKNDEAAIKALVAAGKTVYTYVGFNGPDAWDDLLAPLDIIEHEELVRQLLEKIKELSLTGIIFVIMDLYSGIPDIANKICTLINELKGQSPDTKFGLNIYANTNQTYTKIPNKELFDYSITNPLIDMYFVDMNIKGDTCTPEISQSGTVISSPDKNAVTLEFLSNVISKSTMDQVKTIAAIVIRPRTIASGSDKVYNTYSQYCSTPDAANSNDWCIDGSQRLYDIGACVKQYFAAIAVDWIEYDDVENTCKCPQPYPVTNTLFDGWDGVSIQPCTQMD